MTADITTVVLIGSELSVIVVNATVLYVFLQRFATRGEVERVERESKERDVQMETRLSASLQGVEQRLTRDIHDNRSGNEHRFGELGAKVDGLSSSVQMFANEMNRVVGAIEGRLNMMKDSSNG